MANEEEIWKQWRESGRGADLARLSKSVSDMISSAEKANPGLSPHLVRARAFSAVADAARSYDPDAGASFRTHLYNYMKPLHTRGHTMLQGVGVTRYEDEFRGRFKSAWSSFIEENEREPTVDEIADIMGIPARKAGKLIKSGFSYEVPESTVEFSSGDDSSGGISNSDAFKMVYGKLPAMDKLIVDYRLGLNGRPALGVTEIAAMNKVSPAYVSVVANRVGRDVAGFESKLRRRKSNAIASEDEVPEGAGLDG